MGIYNQALLRIFQGFFGAYCFLFAFLAIGQVSSGSLYQQIQREGNFLPGLPEPVEVGNSMPMGGGDQKTILVRAFLFSGNALVSDAQLDEIAQKYLNRPITFSELRSMASQITEYYRQEGWLVRVSFPRQEIRDGVIKVHIIEAKMGDIKINNLSTRSSDARVETWVYGGLPKEAFFSINQLDRSILTLNDMPDISVEESLVMGSRSGYTDLLVNVKDKSLIQGNVGLDNYGSGSTGVGRASTSLSLNGPFGQGEQINVYGMVSEGSSFGRVGFNFPIGLSGLRVGIDVGHLTYRVVGAQFNQLGANGQATTFGLNISNPLIRSRPANLVAIASLGYGDFASWNIYGKVPGQSYTTATGSIGLSGNLLDEISGGGVNAASIALGFGGANNQNQIISGLANSDTFKKVNYSLSRVQKLTSAQSIYLAVNGQITKSYLNSSQQVFLGGPYGVRAYTSGQGPAMQANIGTLELRQGTPWGITASAFYDYAIAQPATGVAQPSIMSSIPSNYVLQGVGLILSYSPAPGTQLTATWAHPTGSPPPLILMTGPIASNVFWLVGNLVF